MDQSSHPNADAIEGLLAFQQAREAELVRRAEEMIANPPTDASEVSKFFSEPGYDSNTRSCLFLRWAAAIGPESGAAFWSVLRGLWPHFDIIPNAEFVEQFARFADSWSLSHAESSLPGTMAIYRGQCVSAPVGISWTLDRTVAERFARGQRNLLVPCPVVLEAMIRREDVAMYLTGRGESEIVVKRVPEYELHRYAPTITPDETP